MPAYNDGRIALGRNGEEAAAQFLESRGWEVVARNVRRREGEIDIVARREGVVAFVEVKTRRSSGFGAPSEAVTYRKQKRIRSLALAMLAQGAAPATEIRFDVIEVRPFAETFSINHIEGAF